MAARLPTLRSLLPSLHLLRLRRYPLSSSAGPAACRPLVGIFWDLDNKPPEAVSPSAAAARLRLAASSLGPVALAVAYANPGALRRAPPSVLEGSGSFPSGRHACGVCGRNFYNSAKLVNHFKQLHEREHVKRLRRLDSARGGQRIRLAAKFSMKMEKYKRAAREVVLPRAGNGFVEELRRGGFRVREAADRAMEADVADAMSRRRIRCVVLVSDDAGFAGILREARARCVKTVVVGGGGGGGALTRCADARFSWEEVASGKARKEAASAAGRWKDRELLRRLEWTYRPQERSDGDNDL